MYGHIADALFVLQLEPGRGWHLLADFGDELLVHLGTPLQAIEGMLQLVNELVGFSSKTSGVAGSLQIGDRTNLISFRLIRNKGEVPPWTLFLGALGFPFFMPALVREPTFHEAGKTTAFDHGYQVEIEVSAVLGCRFAMKGKCSLEFDL